MTGPIPFNRPAQLDTELAYVKEALERGHLSGDGAFTKRCHALLEQISSARKVLLTTSCTHALEMCGLLLDLAPGDEIIVPSFAFVTTVNAFVLRGAAPVFVDVQPNTLNIDAKLIEQRITKRTKAIIALHYGGVACDMDEMLAIANRHGLAVVEDNAHGLFGKYKGKNLGSLGALATQSFHETKNISCGEGGALLINDVSLMQRAEIIREKGTNRSRFFRGQVDKYTWVDVGSSYLPSDILAAVLCAQLEAHERIQARRRAIWLRYESELKDWAGANGVKLPHVPEHCEQAYHVFYMLMPDLQRRQSLIGHLKERGIQAPFHYLPLHLSDMGVKFGGQVGDCPVTEQLSDRLIRLPLFFDLNEDQQSRVIQGVREFDTDVRA
jgi:dTDP-4-amino-4,6-dideoxygalactose transaminase